VDGRQAFLRTKYTRIMKQRERAPEVPLDRFCRRHGISLGTYYHWKKRLADDNSAQRSTSFVPVVMECREPDSVAWAEIRYPNGISLRCTG
jgi:hypothetical protein